MTTAEQRNERFILEEYRRAGIEPVVMADGRLVSLKLALWVRNHSAQPSHEAAE